MKKLRWQILIVLITLGVVGVLLVTQEPGTTQVFAPQPAEGGIYSEALVGAISRLNPLLDLNNAADRDIDRLVFSSLIKFDARGVPVPDLAQSWGVTQDGTIYNISIRNNAYWHDGQPVTSDDVLFTIDYIKSDASLVPVSVREMWKQITINRLSDKMIQFKLPEPFAPFLDYLTFGVLPRHILEGTPADKLAEAPFNLAPVGSGPYRFERLIVENGQVVGVELRAFDQYYIKKPFIDQLIFRYYPTSQAAMDAYRQGDVIAVSQLTQDVLQQALAVPAFSVYSGRLPEMSMILFNLKSSTAPFLADENLRRALLMALNRQRMVDRLLGGQAVVADGPIFPQTWAYYDGIEHVNYDPEGALALLKAKSYMIPASGGSVRANKDGKLLEFSLIYPDNPIHSALALIVQENWAMVGVKVNLEPLPYDQLVNDRLANRTYQAALVDITLARTPDPDPYPFWHQSEATGGQNYTQWDNRTASEFIEQARINTDLNIRARLYRNFQVVFAKELPALPLYYPIYSYGVDRKVLGVQVPPLFDVSDRFLTVTDWYLVTRRSVENPTAVP